MPPNVPRKRLRDASPAKASKRQHVQEKADATPKSRRKATLYDDLDATSTSTAKGSKAFLDSLDESDEGSSLTDLSDADFEDVPMAKRQRTAKESGPDEAGDNDDDDDDDDDDDMIFEDVAAPNTTMLEAPNPTGDLELTLHRDTRISLTNPFGEKKGPSKIERKVRNASHCVHVQCLLWHNAVRNSWLCDSEVQAIMMSHLPPRLFDEVDRWRNASGVNTKPKETIKKGSKYKGGGATRGKQAKGDKSRDWGAAADKLEEGTVDMSHGDPLFRLMKSLSSWWKQRFKVTVPGIRKSGYMSLERIDRHTKAWATTDYSAELYGERVTDVGEFREYAARCSGSRDIGAQLFTALLRALGLEARMVASLQPLGFGWNKMEEAEPEKDTSTLAAVQRQKAADAALGDSMNSAYTSKSPSTSGTPRKQGSKTPVKGKGRARQRSTGKTAIQDSDDGSEELGVDLPDSDEESVVEIGSSSKSPRTTRTFDKDLEFPHYWTEVLSPVTNLYLPVDPIVKKVVATNRELVESLEPRGGKADKARQVMAYVVGYAQDGTAKDVTVRYLKRQMLPGRTKGVRMPKEKVPIYNQNGKVKRYEQFDWFKSVMRGFERGGRKHPITETDEAEDATDLKPAQPEKKEVKEGEETLQYYKQSKEFCLERHLKREEALQPGAKPVKTFANKSKSKSRDKDKTKDGEGGEEPVYSREDVVNVKSAETWHKQGRAPLPGQRPLKMVPYRAATTNRRREIAEAEAMSGEKVLQGLYSYEQTDWIIPPPIQDGVIPKNGYGNIDLFAEHMCPEGAVHVPFRGAAKVCKRLQIDYAEAVVDFEFGHRMAVPVIQGVVCAEEYHDQVMEEIRKDEAERTRKEDEKKRKEMLRLWSKFIKGLRIVERIREDYGHIRDDFEVFGHKGGQPKRQAKEMVEQQSHGADEDMAGGFFHEGHEEEGPGPDSPPQPEPPRQRSNFFPVVDEDEEDGPDDLVVDHGEHAQNEIPSRFEEDAHTSEDMEQVGSPEPAKARPKPKPKPKLKPKTKPRKESMTTGTRRSTRQRGKTKNMKEEDTEEEDRLDEEFMASDSSLE